MNSVEEEEEGFTRNGVNGRRQRGEGFTKLDRTLFFFFFFIFSASENFSLYYAWVPP